MTDTHLSPIVPAAVRYIKLGQGNGWEASALDGGRLEFGYEKDSHALAFAGDWPALQSHYVGLGLSSGTATRFANELRAFYTLGTDTLWITFARGSLWWAFAEPEVIYRGSETKTDGSRYRRTIGPWRNTDIRGGGLSLDSLSTRLTQVAAYRGTICGISDDAYLLARLNAAPQPIAARATAARAELVDSITALIQQLHWAEFELLVDLLFSRSGWRRVSVLGGTMKDIDLLLEQPITGERIAVQVKSRADQGVLDTCLANFAASGLADRFYFICHSSARTLTVPPADARQTVLWGITELARAAVDAGLAAWLIDKAG